MSEPGSRAAPAGSPPPPAMRGSKAADPVASAKARRAMITAAIGARLDDLRLAQSAIGAHRLRSGLTLLGIVIGVFTVVAMMSLLNGLQASIDKNMGGLGA